MPLCFCEERQNVHKKCFTHENAVFSACKNATFQETLPHAVTKGKK